MASLCLHKSNVSSSEENWRTVWKESWTFHSPEWVYFPLPAVFLGTLMFNKLDVQSHSLWLVLLSAHPKHHACIQLPASHLFCSVLRTSHTYQGRIPSWVSLFPASHKPVSSLVFSCEWLPNTQMNWHKSGTHSCHFPFPHHTLPSQFFPEFCWCSLKFLFETHQPLSTILAVATISHPEVNRNSLLSWHCFHMSPPQTHQPLRYC